MGGGVLFNDKPAVDNMAQRFWIHLSTGTKKQEHFLWLDMLPK